MKYIPILFSKPMVQAIMEDRKTITRRVIKPQPINNAEIDGNFFEGNHKGYVKIDGHFNWRDQFANEFSKYQVGDILWVRETWRKYSFVDEHGYTHFDKEIIDFAADKPELIAEVDGDGCHVFNKDGTEKFIPWKPSIFMPKAACRFFLEVVSVRPERLQDITEEDAIREGVQENICEDKSKCWSKLCKEECAGKGEYYHYSKPMDFDLPPCVTAVESFETLWTSINGEESWKVNPWVWRIEYKKVSKPDNF